MKILEFKATPGFGKWKKYYPKEAIAHPAKINQNLLEYLILNYTKEGETVCDPMAGSGSTGVMCALNDRNCISVELEQKFWKWMEEARENVENTPQLTKNGKIINICGDSRKLSELLKKHEEEISSVLFSPPYGASLAKENPNRRKEYWKGSSGGYQSGHGIGDYGESERNIGNLPTGNIDSIIFSAPYGEAHQNKNLGLADGNRKDLRQYSWLKTDNPLQIDNLPLGKIDSVIFSPPYTTAGAKADENPENYIRRAKERRELMKEQGINRPEKEPGRYSGSWDNIGNLPFDVAIFSPPYSLGHDSGDSASDDYKERLEEQRRHTRVYGSGNIAKLLFISTILFSPPYSESLNEKKNTASNLSREERLRTKGHLPSNFMGGIARNCQIEDGMRYSNNELNIGNLRHGNIEEIDFCLFSPPYYTQKQGGEANENTMAERWDKIAAEKEWNTWGKTWTTEGRLRALKSLGSGYSEDKENIGNLKEFGMDLINHILFSPPYEESLGNKHHSPRADALVAEKNNPSTYTDASITSPPYESSLEGTTRHTKGGIPSRDKKLAQTGSLTEIDESVSRLREHGRSDNKAGGAYGKSLAHKYSPEKENIGNQKKETYISAMKLVYEQCFSVLKPGGLMILILKNFIRQKQLVKLTDHTIKLCESVGFTLKDRLLFRLPQQSFWRVLGKKQWEAEGREYPKDLSYEHVLIFEK